QGSRTRPGLHAVAREYAGSRRCCVAYPGLADSPWATRCRPRVRGLQLPTALEGFARGHRRRLFLKNGRNLLRAPSNFKPTERRPADEIQTDSFCLGSRVRGRFLCRSSIQSGFRPGRRIRSDRKSRIRTELRDARARSDLGSVCSRRSRKWKCLQGSRTRLSLFLGQARKGGVVLKGMGGSESNCRNGSDNRVRNEISGNASSEGDRHADRSRRLSDWL